MGRHVNKRISLTLGTSLYQDISRIRVDYGFGSVAETACAALRRFVEDVKAGEETAMRTPPPTAHDEIEDMFGELSYWEERPFGHPPVRRFNRRLNDQP